MNTDDPIKKAQEVMKLIPHRYPFLLLDRILSYDSDSLVAIKSVSINEPFVQGHFPDRPITVSYTHLTLPTILRV